jgi:hypothetical protein
MENEELLEEIDTHWDNDFRRILNIDDFTFEHLKMMSGWAYRLSVCGFIFSACLIVGCLLLSISEPHLPILVHLGSWGFILCCILLLLIVLYPSYCFYLFAQTLRGVTNYPHQGRFNLAVQYLNNALMASAVIAILLFTTGLGAIIMWFLI